MANSEQHDPEVPVGDLFRPLVSYRRVIWQGTIAVILIAALLGAVYYIWQPAQWSGFVDFSPIFPGASQGKYPNDLPFASTDVVNEAVVEQVYHKNQLQEYCSSDDFRSGLVVLESSPSLQFLDLDFQARLSDTRLSAGERQRLQDEYAARRSALARQYQLLFVQPRSCAKLPSQLVYKALVEIIETWAVDAEQKRGVMKLRTGVLTPGVFDQGRAADESLLVRADLVRSAITRVVANITEVESLPGAEVVRFGESHVSLAELRARLEDLLQAQLDPLISSAGRGLGRRSVAWVEQALHTATARQKAAEARAESYRVALREYSGTLSAPAGSGAAIGDRAPSTSSDVQMLTPQIDRSFIDRIVDMSQANIEFRQEITRRMFESSVEGVKHASTVYHYTQLLASLTQRGEDSMTVAEVSSRLEGITAEARELTKLFNSLYDELSRVSLRIGPMMYRIERPADSVSLKGFSLRYLAFLLLGTLIATPILLAVGCLMHYHARAFVRKTLAATRAVQNRNA